MKNVNERGIVMRYTKKSEKFINAYEWGRKLGTKSFVQLGMNKLGQLEDIEEELGIDLITLGKLFNERYAYAFDNHCQPTKNSITFVSIYDKTIHLYNGVCNRIYPLKDYGRMFALTKEELL